MSNHKFNLKSKGWSIIKSKNLYNIELLSKNFLQELKKLIHIRAYLKDIKVKLFDMI